MKASSKLALFALLGAGFFAGRAIWSRMPPYEQGIHVQEVRASVTAGQSDSPHIGDCPVFPADNVWNTPVDHLPKDKRSEAYIRSIGTAVKLHPDFGAAMNSGIPYTLVKFNQHRVPVKFDYSNDSDLGHYPIPPDAPIEGGPASTGDRHILLIDTQRCILHEIYSAHAQSDGSWHAGSGARFDLTSNALREDHKTSADAGGLPIFPGLVRYDEVAAGSINHALRFTIKVTQAAYIWPARHKASKNSDPDTPPMGLRIRLRPDFDISSYSKSNQVILTAMKRYGMILADNGSSVYFSGVADKRWNDDDLHKLTSITAENFEAVDESNLQMLSDSARVDPIEAKR